MVYVGLMFTVQTAGKRGILDPVGMGCNIHVPGSRFTAACPGCFFVNHFVVLNPMFSLSFAAQVIPILQGMR